VDEVQYLPRSEKSLREYEAGDPEFWALRHKLNSQELVTRLTQFVFGTEKERAALMPILVTTIVNHSDANGLDLQRRVDMIVGGGRANEQIALLKDALAARN